MKRLSALILSCVLIVSLTLPAFAVSPEVHSDVGVAKEMRASIDWKEWAKLSCGLSNKWMTRYTTKRQ